MNKPAIAKPSRKPAPSSKKKRKTRWWQWPWFSTIWSRVLLGVGILLFITCSVVLINAYYRFSRMIDRKISGEVFQNTAQVYSTPLTLFPGQTVRPLDVTEYLRKSGYTEKGKGASRIGEFQISTEGLEIAPHADSYYGAGGPRVLVEFNKRAISRITDLSGKNLLVSYDVEPQIITNFFDKTREKRRLITYEDVPQVLREAVLSIEDRRFFEHRGFDPIGMLRASFVDLVRWERAQGASTITQQLVRSFWLTPQRRAIRKLKEIYMSIILETRLSKEEIFTLYANDVYLGQRGSFSINGFGEAATAYFGKDIKSLTLPEAALIAGLIQTPNRYNPNKYPDRALQRRNVVLQSMLDTNSITREQYQAALRSPLNVIPTSNDASDAPYFVDLIKDQLLEKYSEKVLLSEQYKIYTTLDLELQRFAVQAVKEGAKNVDQILAKKRQRKLNLKKGEPRPEIRIDANDRVQACLVALDPHTGEIRALVGGRDYGSSQLNRVVYAKRQPGSVFKPFVFAACLNSALTGSEPLITASTIVLDTPTVFEFDDKTYEPNNYGEKFYGPVTLRKALTKSLNVATIKFAEMAGLQNVVTLAREAGMNDKLLATPALALGAYEVTPLEMARAFTIFANSGVRVEPVFIKTVRETKGNVLEQSELKTKEVLDPKIAYLMTNLMEGVINHGTGARARGLGFTPPAAGKTGTSHDGWFAGYTNGLLCIAWVGFDDNRELGLDGATSALPIWTEFMKKAVAARPWLANSAFVPPGEGITTVQIDVNTGLIASPECQEITVEYFIAGAEPKQFCNSAAHEWIASLQNTPSQLAGEPQVFSSQDPARLAPLVPPVEKKTNPIKRFFSKIF
jgi:penicillin-binding protein 1B